jgi:hypothetical protein
MCLKRIHIYQYMQVDNRIFFLQETHRQLAFEEGERERRMEETKRRKKRYGERQERTKQRNGKQKNERETAVSQLNLQSTINASLRKTLLYTVLHIVLCNHASNLSD